MRPPAFTFDQSVALLRAKLAAFHDDTAPSKPRTFAEFCQAARRLEPDELDRGLTVVLTMRDGAAWVGELASVTGATVALRLWGGVDLSLARDAVALARLIESFTWAERSSIAARQRDARRQAHVRSA